MQAVLGPRKVGRVHTADAPWCVPQPQGVQLLNTQLNTNTHRTSPHSPLHTQHVSWPHQEGWQCAVYLFVHTKHPQKAGPFSVARLKVGLPFHSRLAHNRGHKTSASPLTRLVQAWSAGGCTSSGCAWPTGRGTATMSRWWSRWTITSSASPTTRPTVTTATERLFLESTRSSVDKTSLSTRDEFFELFLLILML